MLRQKGGFGMEYVLTAENLGKRYGQSKALDGFSMRIPKGSIYGFVGRNGAGKTTLIRLICGLQEPTEGSFILYGIRNSDPGIVQARQNMGAVVEAPALYPEMTAEDNLKQQYRILGLSSFEGISDLLHLVGLENTGKKKVKSFSLGMKQRLVMAQALSVSDMDGIVNLQKTVLKGSFAVESVGASILFVRFLPEFGFSNALKWGVFHSISAFCNAGFDIFGCITPGASLMEFQSDPVVLLTLSALVITGGLGFLVWQDVVEKCSFHKCSVYTRLVLLTTAGLLLTGWAGICLLEWNNPGTLGPMSLGDKLLNGLFQSVTLRTAGFISVDQALLTDSGKAASMILMLVGGSSGSTAGGLKTVTILVLLLFVWAKARGKQSVHVFKRNIPGEKAVDAMTITFITALLSIFGAMVISATSSASFLDAWYEAVSAICTVGLTAAGTASLGTVSQCVIIAFMYFGRVGILTLSLGFLMGNKAKDRFQYADTNLLIG